MTNQMTPESGMADRAGGVATTAREEARGVAGDVRQEASNVASEAAAQAHNLVDETRSAVRSQAREGTDRAAGALDQLGMRLRALADGDAESAGELRRYAEQASDRLQAAADRLGSRGFDGLVDDVQSFARRRPGVFLAVAAGAGFAAGRLFRGAQAAASSSPSPGAEGEELASLPAPSPSTTGTVVAGPEGGTTPATMSSGGAASTGTPTGDPGARP
jgi:ElaB/YqjD/DUF883 family membrane-anchored ribosome-binding protein